MSALILRNRFQGSTTLVDNEFIDRYMPAANGEYVKVYLLLLRHLNSPCAALSISRMADYLENTEGDILRALKYWEKEGLLTLEYDRNGSVIGLEMGKTSASGTSASAASVPAAGFSPAAEPSVAETPSPNAAAVKRPKSASTRNRRELKQILFVAEQYLGKTLTRTDVDTIAYFYDDLGFSADLIEYLIEYCVENGHKSMHYIQKVALAWADSNITSAEQARETSAIYNKNCYSILNAFGIKGRGPATAELGFIRKWTEAEGLSLELILEACNRTISSIHQPSFEYTDKILENWRSHDVHTLADVHTLDSAYAQEKASSRKPARRQGMGGNASSKFRSFEEHSYDMDELTKELLRNS